MRTNSEVRLDNLSALISEVGGARKLAALYGCTEGYIRQMQVQSIDKETGKKKGIGNKTARRLEECTGKNEGWLDQDHALNAGLIASAPSEPVVFVREYKINLSAGPGQHPLEEIEESEPATYKLSFLKELGVNPKNAVRLKVKGTSMYPLINDGDTVLVDTADNQQITARAVYALRHGDDLLIKRLTRLITGGLLIQSDNSSEYPPQQLSEQEAETQIKILGRVRERSGTSGL